MYIDNAEKDVDDPQKMEKAERRLGFTWFEPRKVEG